MLLLFSAMDSMDWIPLEGGPKGGAGLQALHHFSVTVMAHVPFILGFAHQILMSSISQKAHA